jgi:hypothetical protein
LGGRRDRRDDLVAVDVRHQRVHVFIVRLFFRLQEPGSIVIAAAAGGVRSPARPSRGTCRSGADVGQGGPGVFATQRIPRQRDLFRISSGRSPPNAQLTSMTISAGRLPNPPRVP